MKAIMEQIDEVIGEICDKYCKYPDVCMAERKDPDEATGLLYEKYCANCPINRL